MFMRKFLKCAWRVFFILFVIVAGIHIVSAFTFDRIIQYKEISFSSPKIPKDLDGYVIAFITDTHDIKPAKLMQIIDRVNARNVNLMLLGGDYVWHDSDGTMRILSRVKTRDGVYGVDGNHDSLKDLRLSMSKYGFTLLEDRGFEIKPGFYLGGVTFFGGDQPFPSIKNAVAQAGDNDFVLLLAHNPDIALMQSTEKVDLVLAGHTHGGQITLFGLWAPGLKSVTAYGHKFKAGWVDVQHNTKVFVSKGLGTSGTSTRVFARPQVIFLTLRAQ